MKRTAFAPLAIALVALAGCPKNSEGPAQDAAPEASAVKDAEVEASGGGEDVEPVYPDQANAPKHPLAVKLCEALTEMPEKRRSECCKAAPGTVVTAECVRMLSVAIHQKAVEVSDADIDACAAAYGKVLDGCDWVGPFPPAPPSACQGILKGKLALGAKCRSSLECGGTMRCAGVGPTAVGRCTEGKADGEICGGIVDTLAGYTRQIELEKQHPECKDKCVKRKCAPASTAGQPCQTTADCASGLSCIATPGPAPKVGLPPKTCATAKLPAKGEACPGGECEGELQCIKNKCGTRKSGGEDCTVDFECRGGCIKGDAGDKGKCGPRCDIR
ncbi:MAG TPA: hypothetical protein VIF62_18825 [Labilithrix sp.]